MPYILTLLMLGLLTACKTVDVLIPAKYSLADSKEIVVHEFKGASGASISHHVLAELQQKVPHLTFYTATPDGHHASMLHLKGSVDAFHISEPHIYWGEFDSETHQQAGSVERHVDMQVLIQLENGQHQVLWSQVFSVQRDIGEDFSLYSDEAYQDLDGGSDILEGKILSGISDLVQQSDLEDDALSNLPDRAYVRQNMVLIVSHQIAQSFYDRTEQHLEFK